jgi:hypothetical protein
MEMQYFQVQKYLFNCPFISLKPSGTLNVTI